MKSNARVNIAVAVSVLCLCGMSTSIAGITNTWDNASAPGGNAPTNAYRWASTANWKNPAEPSGIANPPVPSSLGDGADLGTPATAPRFIELPDSLNLTYVKWGAGNYLLGNMYLGEDGKDFPVTTGGTLLDSGTILFGDFRSTSTKTEASISAWAIAGNFSAASAYWTRAGDLTMRMDLWADSTASMRAAPFQDDGANRANGNFTFFGPRGAPAQSGVFSQTAQSPYVKVVAMEGAVAPGSQIVGAAGIPEGTFVRYVFGDSGWLQLSENATQTLAENTFNFTAITPSVEQVIRKEIGRNAPSLRRMRAIKYREEDGLRLVFTEVKTMSAHIGRAWGLTAAECENGWIPGDVVISNVVTETAFAQTNRLYTARLELPNVLDSHWLCGADCDSRLTVPEGRTGGLRHVRDFKGKLEKRGAGTLELGVDGTVVPGSFKATEGRAKLYSTEDGQPLTLAKIELAAGATLEIPEAGLNVSNLVAEAGSCVCGPGKLTVLVSTTGVPGVAEGAELEVPAKSSAASVVQDGRWMHLDATVGNSLETTRENDVDYVTSWNDIHGGACSAKACGQGQPGFGLPWIRRNAYLGKDYLDLGPVVSNDGGAMSGPMRCLQFYNGTDSYSYGESGGTLDAPYIHAAFMMVGSEYGGGALLSSSGTHYWAHGFPHTQDTEFTKNIVSCKTGYSEARFANYSPWFVTFRVNGVNKIANNGTKFSGGWDVFTYANTNNNMRSGGLGNCNLGELGNLSQSYDSCYGGLLYGEVIIYTQALTSAQVDNIEMYLRHKWRGEDFPGCFAETAALNVGTDSVLSVVGGGAVETSAIGGGGTICGDLALTEGGNFDVVVGADGQVPTLTVEGKATLPAHATVTFSGSRHRLRIGDYAILAFGSCEGDVSGWEVLGADDRRAYSVVRIGNGIVVRIVSTGMSIFVR